MTTNEKINKKCDGKCEICLREWLESEGENGRIYFGG